MKTNNNLTADLLELETKYGEIICWKEYFRLKCKMFRPMLLSRRGKKSDQEEDIVRMLKNCKSGRLTGEMLSYRTDLLVNWYVC